MTDPITVPAGASIAKAAAVTLACAETLYCVLGVPLELLIWGAVGGFIALIYAEPRQPPLTGVALFVHAVGRLISASVIGGLAPALIPVIEASLEGFSKVGSTPLAPVFIAVAAGMGTAFLPEIFKLGRSMLERRMNA